MRYFKLNIALLVQILHPTQAQGQIPHPREGLEPQISYSPSMEKSQLSRGMPGWGGEGVMLKFELKSSVHLHKGIP